jgi:hypothetical protein
MLFLLVLLLIPLVTSNQQATENEVTAKILARSLLYAAAGASSLLHHGLELKQSKLASKYFAWKDHLTIVCGDTLQYQNVIVFVHGRNGWYTDFEGFIRTLTNHDIQSYDRATGSIQLANEIYYLRSSNLGETGYTTIDADVATLRNQIKNYLDCKLILIGHSKGGLVASRYASNMEDDRIEKIITVSSPLTGSLVVNMFYPKESPVYQSLSYRNDISLETETKIERSAVDIYHIVPGCDHLILPKTSAYYKSTPKEKIYHYEECEYSHAGIMESPKVVSKIIEWIVA